MLLTKCNLQRAQSILGDFCAKAEWGRNPRESGKEKNGPLFVSRDALQCLDGFLDRLRLGSLGGLSKQPAPNSSPKATNSRAFCNLHCFCKRS